MAREKKPTGPKPVDPYRRDDKRTSILTSELCGLSDPWDAKATIRAWIAEHQVEGA
jgi:hypothetical protein